MKLLLHIGAGKTGSTSIQGYLDKNRGVLASAGILYPKISSRIDNNPLAIATNSPAPREFIHILENKSAELFGECVWTEAAESIDGRSGDMLILSSEYWSAGSVSVNRLIAHVRRYFPKVTEIETICYIRPPVSEYLSRLQQDLKASSLVSKFNGRRYAPLLERFSRIGVVKAKVFDRSSLKGGNVLFDFIGHLPQKISNLDLVEIPQKNVSVSAEGMAVMQEFRMHVFPHHDNVFKLESNKLLRKIQKVEYSLGKEKFSVPSLQPDVARYLARETEDIAALRDKFGIDLISVNTRAASLNEEAVETPRYDERDLASVLVWDDDRKNFLLNQVIKEFLCK